MDNTLSPKNGLGGIKLVRNQLLDDGNHRRKSDSLKTSYNKDVKKLGMKKREGINFP